ncbi:MAG: S41 family peptidase [Nitrospirota bacterium]
MYQVPEKRSYHLLVYVFVAVVSFILGWQTMSFGYLGGASVDIDRENITGEEDSIADEVDIDLFWTVWDQLDDYYYDEEKLDEETLIYGSIKGLVDSIEDPYTVFMTPEESEDFSASLEGTLEGIGAELTVDGHNLVVVSPLRDSPAEKAGLLPGDIIFLIEGELASEMTLFDAIMSIRGEKGTTVTLTIVRDGLDNSFDVSIVRAKIDIESVTVEELEGDITYISVNQFNEKTNEEFGKAISELILDEPNGIIVDLRYNGGGYLDIAIELLSYLLPSETEAVIVKQRGMGNDVMLTNGNPKILSVPLVVLINEGSASASEIVAGAIQDHERGVVMGTQSFGKGSVQEVDSFSDGSSIRMTIAKWYTPDDRSIDKVGLVPDVVVELSDEDIENEFDSQKEAAREYLLNL